MWPRTDGSSVGSWAGWDSELTQVRKGLVSYNKESDLPFVGQRVSKAGPGMLESPGVQQLK